MPAQLRVHAFADLWHPWVLAWIFLLQVAYLLAVGPLRRGFKWGPKVPVRQQVLFSLGLWTVYVSEGSRSTSPSRSGRCTCRKVRQCTCWLSSICSVRT